MPLIALAVLALFLVLTFVVILPLSLVQRYRVGTSRQLARGWLTTLNLAGISISAAMLLAGAAVTSIWVPRALAFTSLGLAAGCTLGIVGLMATRWEATPRALYYTPSRWLVLGITLVVLARIGYGFWRAWHAWRVVPDTVTWLAESGAAGSMAAGAVVLGYYLAYSAGVRRRIRRHSARRATGSS